MYGEPLSNGAPTPSTHTFSPGVNPCAPAIVRVTTLDVNALLTTVVSTSPAAVQNASLSVSPIKPTAVVSLCSVEL